MAKIAAPAPFPQTSNLQFGGGGSKVTTTLKRKTPSEIRGELLKRNNVNAVEFVDTSSFLKDGDGALLGNMKDLPKNPRYIDTRMDELYRARKSSISLKLLRKDTVKEKSPDEGRRNLRSSRLSNSSVAAQDFCKEESPTSVLSPEPKTVKDAVKPNKIRSVAELSLGDKNVQALSKVDMDNALKGLAAHDHIADSELQPEYYEKIRPSVDSVVSGEKTPLDLTLKTTMRIISSTSVKWFHRSVNHGTFYNQSQSGSGAPCSWVYPQSPLPPPAIAALSSDGAGDFLSIRQQAWEDSFRSLYYMLRKEICDLFYVCTSQFVVMFVGSKKAKRTCNAYISQSTRGLRSLLKENDVCFSMPLVHSKGGDIAAEDLGELGKPSLEQADHFTMSGVDNSSESLLMFSGNQNVHGLYDFLLNYRFIMTSLTGVDVPLLYSPVPFKNAAHSFPQVRCKEVMRADHVHLPQKDPLGDDEPIVGSSSGFCYSVEVKDTYLPPWVVSSICSAMASEGNSFKASFVTDPASTGLNVALDTISPESETEASNVTIHPKAVTQASVANNEASRESPDPFGVSQTMFSPHLRSSFLKKLKYGNDGSYTASLSHV